MLHFVIVEKGPVLYQQGKTRSLEVMVLNDFSQTFLFTFRCNGEAHGQLLAEARVEQLAGYDASPAADAFRRSWFGTEEALGPMLTTLGFEALDVKGISAALHSHRDADRKLAVTPDQLQAVGFRETMPIRG